MSCFSVEGWIGTQVWSPCFVILNQPPAEILKLVTFALMGFWWPCSTCRGEKLYLGKKDTYFHSELEDSPFSTPSRTPETLLQPSISCLQSLSFSALSPIPDDSLLPHTVGENAEFGRSKVLPLTWRGKPLKQAICYHANWLLIIFYKYPVPPKQTFYQWGFWKTCINNRVFHTPAIKIKIKIYCLKILLAGLERWLSG